MWLLLCAVFYQGGVAVAITLAAIYAETGDRLQAAGNDGADLRAEPRGGGRAPSPGATCRTASATRSRWAARWSAGSPPASSPRLTTTKGGFWWAAAIAGLCMGSSQSAGRAMAGMFAPRRQLAEFYGLWTFAIRLASIIGPLSYGAITWATGGNQRLAIMSTAVLFIAGWCCCAGERAARPRGGAAGGRCSGSDAEPACAAPCSVGRAGRQQPTPACLRSNWPAASSSGASGAPPARRFRSAHSAPTSGWSTSSRTGSACSRAPACRSARPVRSPSRACNGTRSALDRVARCSDRVGQASAGLRYELGLFLQGVVQGARTSARQGSLQAITACAPCA